jgi:hypothetical protein
MGRPPTTTHNEYIARTGTLTFAPGETMKTIVVNGDSKKEADETFYRDLFGNSLFTKNRGTDTIRNDDCALLMNRFQDSIARRGERDARSSRAS